MRSEKLISSERLNQLAAARAVLADSGKSPRQLGIEARLKVLIWLYRWGYASADGIQSMLGRTVGGYAQKLVRQGWLVATKTESGSPEYCFTLSVRGLEEAERYTPILLKYPEIDPYRVNQQQIRHYLIAQSATVNALNSGAVVEYETERMYSHSGDRPGEKRPDVVWTMASGLRIACEIELSAKWERHLDQFILGIARALQSQNGQTAKFDRFAVITDSPAILRRYRDAMRPDAPLNIWSKNQRNHWAVDKSIKVPAWLIERVDFQLLGR